MFNGLYSACLGFIIALIVVGLVTPAIGDLGRGAGRRLGVTAAIASASTVLSGLPALVVARTG